MAQTFNQPVNQSPPPPSGSDSAIHYLEAPEFESSDAASAFDRAAFNNDPKLRRFLRRCSRTELPSGKYETICGPQKQVVKLIVQVFPGLRVAAIFTLPNQTPEELIADFEQDPAIAELIRNMEVLNVNN
jgi:hypothetical protein